MKPKLLTGPVLVLLAVQAALAFYQRPEVSAELGRQYAGGGVAFRYPEGWEARDSEGMLVVAPADAYTKLASGEEWITRGLMMGLSHPQGNAGLWVSTAELFKALQGSNPSMVQVGTPQSLEVDEFATVFMMMAHQESGALQAAQWWAGQTSEQEALSKIFVDDRHTLSGQRARNIIRWLNNKQELVTRWQRILVPNVQTEALVEELKTGEFDKDLARGELRRRGIPTP